MLIERTISKLAKTFKNPHFSSHSTMFERLKSFIVQCVRVFKITKKPSKDEFRTIVKVSGIGILIIGFIGFIIHVLYQLIFR